MSGKNILRLVPAVFMAIALVWPAVLKAEETWEISGSLGAAVVAAPEFEGSDRYRARVLPVGEVRYGPAFLSLGKDLGGMGLGLDVARTREWTVAPALRYRWARAEKDSDLLRGMGDIKDGVEAGGLIRWQPGPAGLSLKVFQGLGQMDGLTAELEANYSAALTASLTGSVRLSTMFADSSYHRRYFGVTPEQSVNSGYQAYDPGAGLKHAAVSGALGYALTEHLGLGLSAGYKRLTGPAADSPLVERGSANQFLSALSVSFNF
jgi:outer membrane scaffolding protein for murein synthesis (MipA/OmpV family)